MLRGPILPPLYTPVLFVGIKLFSPRLLLMLRPTKRHMDGRLRDRSAMSRRKPKICHIGRHFIKVPQTMPWVTVNIAVWINSAGLGLDPRSKVGLRKRARPEVKPSAGFKTRGPVAEWP